MAVHACVGRVMRGLQVHGVHGYEVMGGRGTRV